MNRILLLIKGLGRGGAEQLLVSAAPYLDKEAFRYEVAYLLPWKDALVDELRGHGIGVTNLDGGRGLGWARRLRNLVEERGIDLVHVHSPYPAVIARMMLRKPTKLAYTEHNHWRRYRRITYWGNVLTFPRNDYVFTVSREVERAIQYPKFLAFRSKPPIETLYHGIDPATVGSWRGDSDLLRSDLHIGERDLVVGTVANFKTHKGYEYLVHAASRVLREMPATRFVFVGQGPTEDETRRLVRRLGLEDAVIFAGFRDDAPRLTGLFDVFVLPSLWEGLPIALLEAMALGRPVVATRVGGTPEVITSEGEGILVPPAEPGALAAAIVKLLREPVMRTEMGREARARAESFDIRKAVRRTESIYRELLA